MKKRLLNKLNIGYMMYYDEFIKNVVDQPQVVEFAAMSNPTKIKKKKHSNMKKYLLIKISKK